jgi:predicted phage baseplate assembly protein
MAFDLNESPVVDGSINVYVQDGDVYSKWTKVQHLVDYGPSDTVYTVFLNEDNTVTVNFGDGVSGAIPTAYSEIRATYTVGGGAIGNVSVSTITTLSYIAGFSEGQLTALQGNVTVTNESTGIGGSDPESNDQIRVAAPAAIRSGNRAVSLGDFADISLSVSGVGKANATAEVWTSVTVYIAPSRTALDTDPQPGLDDLGDPSAEYIRLKADVETALSDKLLIGATATVQPPTYVDVVVNLQYAILDQYTLAEVETNIKTALLTGFGYLGVNFKDTIYPQDIEFVVQQAAGVKTVKVLALAELGGSGLNTLVGGPGELYRFTEANLSLGEI